MLTEHSGNIFTSEAPVLVNPVNLVGVMGKGLAKQMAHRHPDLLSPYRAACDSGDLRIGTLMLFEAYDDAHSGSALPAECILNFPTKRHWRDPSRLADIEIGLEILARNARRWYIAMPRLGCGNGGLDWADVRPLIYWYLQSIPALKVEIWHGGSPTLPAHIPCDRSSFRYLT